MKKKEKAALRTMKPEELVKRIAALESQVVKVRLEKTTRPAKNTRAIFALRKSIAVAKSILEERRQAKTL